MTKIDIISGFLGAGKTTFIQKLISEDTFSGEKLAIVENEFGKVGIDGMLLSNEGIEIRELSAGCICCSLSADLLLGVQALIDKVHPDRIIIEPTGISKLSQVSELLSTLRGIEIDAKIVIVDAERFQLYYRNFGEFFTDQIAEASLVLMSHVAPDRDYTEIFDQMRSLRPEVSIISEDWRKIPANDLLKYSSSNLEESKSFTGKNSIGDFESVSFTTQRLFTPESIRLLLKEMELRFPNIIRAKGILRSGKQSFLRFDYVYGEAKVAKILGDFSPRGVFIGERPDREGLKKLLEEVNG